MINIRTPRFIHANHYLKQSAFIALLLQRYIKAFAGLVLVGLLITGLGGCDGGVETAPRMQGTNDLAETPASQTKIPSIEVSTTPPVTTPSIGAPRLQDFSGSIPTTCSSELVAYGTTHGIAFTCANNPSLTLDAINLSPWLGNSRFRAFSFSPGQNYLAFLTLVRPSGGYQLFLVDLRTNSVDLLSENPTAISLAHLDWSHDGRYLAYSLGNSIEILDVQTGVFSHIEIQQLIGNLTDLFDVDWLPTDMKLSFIARGGSGQNPNAEPYVADLNCSKSSFVCTASNTKRQSWSFGWLAHSWSPDGSLVGGASLMLPQGIEHYTIEIANADSTQKRTIDVTAVLRGLMTETSRKLAFSSDNSRIVFLGINQESGAAIYLLDVTTQQVTLLAQVQDIADIDVQWLDVPK